MALTISQPDFPRLSSDELELWSHIPTSIISDELNRTGTLHSEVRPLQSRVSFAGQALTVQCMVGDNAPIHYAMTVAWPGCVMLVDGRGHKNTALFGGAAPDSVWLEGDLEMMRRCDAILCTDDWERSAGARDEVKLARELNIPVFFSIAEFETWLRKQ